MDDGGPDDEEPDDGGHQIMGPGGTEDGADDYGDG